MYIHQPPSNAEAAPHRSQQPATNDWTDEPTAGAWEDVASQRPAGAAENSIPRQYIPASLRPGGGAEVAFGSPDDEDSVWNEARNQPLDLNLPGQVPDALRPGVQRAETNPFLRKQTPSQTPSDTNLQAPPITLQPPTVSLSNLSLEETSIQNPWQPPIGTQSPLRGAELPIALSPGGSEIDPWARFTPEPPAKEPISPKSADLISLHSKGSAWDDEFPSEHGNPTSPPQNAVIPDDLMREQQVWDDLGSLDPGKGKGKVSDIPAAQAAQIDDWSLIDSEPSSSPLRQPQEDSSTDALDEKPTLPPRLSGSRVRWTPSRPPVDGKAETYQVKNIRWHDPSASNNPRLSPILIQNENGPCPLVALVNALTLTTPEEIGETALVQVLRSREQVSLSLLLDAVFDELMSPRRTSSEDSLPDVSELYSFLQSLHTGMNVNPRFIPTPEMIAAYEHTSLTELHPLERRKYIPGTFENTAEMGLYATFSIPLIHGWLPPHDDVVCASMERHAASYEDVQNLLFREEELEDKLATSEEGLTEAEQDLYQDIITIKIFLNESATQLTPWGIEVIEKAIRPGTFAILFRNDHFSTLYCHPHTRQLLTLVTDAGFRSHDEIVWESLRDVNGELNQFLSGDFRLVSGDATTGPSAGAGDYGTDQGGGTWTTVSNKRGKTKEAPHQEEVGQPSSTTEQEDRDLALALQLQEEEDQKHREEQARRKRERALSEQYIEQAHLPIPVSRPGGGNTGASNGPRRDSAATASGSQSLASPRRTSNSVNTNANSSANVASISASASASQRSLPNSGSVSQQVRPLVPPRRQGVNRPPDNSDEPPPPSYEQAAQVPAYLPPPGHPNHHESSPASRQVSRSSVSTGSGPPASAARGRRPGAPVQGARRPGVPASAASSRSDRDCVVM